MRVKLGAIALIATMSCGAAWAQSNPFAGQTPVKTELKKSLNSHDAKVGQEIAATTTQNVTIGTVTFPKGSTLLGHVVDVTKHDKSNPDGKVTIVFDHMQPKKGDPATITASVYEIDEGESQQLGSKADVDMGMRGTAAAQNTTSAVRSGSDNMQNHVSGTVSASDAPVKVVSAVPGVAIAAIATGDKSALFQAKNMDMELLSGTVMVVGVAPK